MGEPQINADKNSRCSGFLGKISQEMSRVTAALASVWPLNSGFVRLFVTTASAERYCATGDDS
jgi:hypothetical protein